MLHGLSSFIKNSHCYHFLGQKWFIQCAFWPIWYDSNSSHAFQISELRFDIQSHNIRGQNGQVCTENSEKKIDTKS